MTSCDFAKNSAMSLHRQTSRAPKSRIGKVIHQTVLTAGICTVSEQKNRTLRRDRMGGKRGQGVIYSRGCTREHTFPIPFCMIPHRGRTSAKLVGARADTREIMGGEDTAFSLTRLEATGEIRGKKAATSRVRRNERGSGRPGGMGLASRSTTAMADLTGTHVDESWVLLDLAN